MSTIELPPPDEIERRIAECELELRELKRLLRMSRSAHEANAARERRRASTPAVPKEASRA